MDKFYKPHKNSTIAEKIREMPLDSVARRVLENQSYQACAWLLESWILTDITREFEEVEHSEKNPMRAAYILKIIKKAVGVNDEGSNETLSETEIELCQQNWSHYNLLSTIKDWINEGELAERIYNVLMEMEELDKQIKSNL